MLPRTIKKRIYFYLNRIKFTLLSTRIGKGASICCKAYLQIHKNGTLYIGDNFHLTSGESINPLSRNIRACICVERPNSSIEIGNNVGISSACIWAKEKIVIGDYVNIGADTIIMDSDAHSLNWRDRASRELIDGGYIDIANAKTSPIYIEDHVLIGTRCIILKGVRIGSRSIIAAGSVVTKNIPSDCIAGGNPCRVIKYL